MKLAFASTRSGTKLHPRIDMATDNFGLDVSAAPAAESARFTGCTVFTWHSNATQPAAVQTIHVAWARGNEDPGLVTADLADLAAV